jgi:cobalt-zinc-cadmium efflux system outer membrane protein
VRARIITLLLCIATTLVASADDPVPSFVESAGSPELIDVEIVEAEFIDADAAILEPAEITLERLEAIALSSHPTIAVARSRVAVTQGQYVQAGLKYNPVMQYQTDEAGVENSSGLHSVQLSQQFVTANKLGLARQVQSRNVQRRRADLRLAELQVLTNLRTTYARALAAQKRVELTNEMVKLTRQSVESVEALYRAEEVSKVSLLQARVESQRAQITADVAATELAAERRSLAAATGIEALEAVRIAGELDEGLTDQPWEVLIDQIYAASPELSAAGSNLEQARWALQHACAQAVPNVTGFVGVGLDAITDDTYGRIGISLPLPIHNRNQGNIRSARANIQVAHAAFDQTRVSLESRLAAAVARYRTAWQRYDRLRQQILPNAEETYELSQAAFAAGESSYLQLMEAQRTLISTRLQALDAIGLARQAMAEIDGMLVTVDK